MNADNSGAPQFTLPEPTQATAAVDNYPAQASPAIPVTQTVSSDEKIDAFTDVSIHRAETIVAQTLSDPFAQAEQLNKLKAEYIKQRFNIDVKLAE